MRKKTTLSSTGLIQIVTKNVLSTFLVCLFFSMVFCIYAHYTEHFYHTSPEEDSFDFKTFKKTFILTVSFAFSYRCGFICSALIVVRMKPKVNGQNDSISGYVLWCRGSKCKQILDYPSSA